MADLIQSLTNKKPEGKTLYRYEREYRYSFDYGDEGCHGDPPLPDYKIKLVYFPVVRETDNTYFIMVNGKEKMCRKRAARSYAFDDREDAMISFRRRTLKAIQHTKRDLINALEFAHLVNQHEENKVKIRLKPFTIFETTRRQHGKDTAKEV